MLGVAWDYEANSTQYIPTFFYKPQTFENPFRLACARNIL